MDKLSDFIEKLRSAKCDECIKAIQTTAEEYGIYPDSLKSIMILSFF